MWIKLAKVGARHRPTAELAAEPAAFCSLEVICFNLELLIGGQTIQSFSEFMSALRYKIHIAT